MMTCPVVTKPTVTAEYPDQAGRGRPTVTAEYPDQAGRGRGRRYTSLFHLVTFSFENVDQFPQGKLCPAHTGHYNESLSREDFVHNLARAAVFH